MSLDKTHAALAGLMTPDGSLGRPDGYGTWQRPAEVNVSGESVQWRGGGEVTTSGREMIEDFVALCERPDESIARFARRWGVLEICEHDRPRSHRPARFDRWADDSVPGCQPTGAFDGSYDEPLRLWRHYSLQAQTMLNIAARLSGVRASPVEASGWAVLEDLYPMLLVDGVFTTHDAMSVDLQRRLLTMAVQEWLALGNVQAHFTWPAERPHFDVGSGSLFGALALQLALAIGRCDALAICDECGACYMPRRQNPPGMPRRCPRRECRYRAAKRDSARRQRAIKKMKPKGTDG